MQTPSMHPALRSFAQDIDRKQRIAQAVAIAECGHAPKALAMIESLPPTDRHAEDWDLMARLLTSMSRFPEARVAWYEAEHVGMPPTRVRHCLTALDARRHCTRIALVLVTAALIIAALVTGLLLLAILT